jgi:hypothetical protein
MPPFRLLLAGLLTAVGLVALTPATSYACSCAVADPEAYVDWADVVFTGTLTDVEPPPQHQVMSSMDPNTYTFDVDRVFEGEVGPTAEVQSAMSGASCGLEGMKAGRDYVVYATHHQGALTTGLCTGTGPVDLEHVESIEQVTGPGRTIAPDLAALLAPLLTIFGFLP